MNTRKALALGALCTLPLWAAACGRDTGPDAGQDTGPDTPATTTAAATTTSAATTTAEAAPEGEAEVLVLRGEFAPVAGGPDAAQTIAGTAEQRRGPDGAVVAVELTGLAPDTDYIVHLHAGSCELADPGGPHFRFDPSGPDEPPNEVHLTFTSDADGAAEATAEVDRPLPDGQATTFVLHEIGPHDHDPGDDPADHAHDAGDGVQPKLACAEVDF
ncbi:hypothetical protein [uncultured Mycolicibacterium sp.]|uniref:hypothetical protein n=1 Tax=uncultured Mycolicibacterium sp. TaxID=2320817 RepID=UPI00262F4E56|nr:hypothetical protein [uncultured Mycolicibacterium sp.]